jgi:hypothetical protein
MACGWLSCTQRFPSRWKPFWQTILAGVVVFAGAAFGVSHLPLFVFSTVPLGQTHRLLTRTFPPEQPGGGWVQVPAATLCGVQQFPFTGRSGAGQGFGGDFAG